MSEQFEEQFSAYQQSNIQLSNKNVECGNLVEEMNALKTNFKTLYLVS